MNYDPSCKYLRDWYQNQCFLHGDPRSEHYDPVKWCQFVINNPDPTAKFHEFGRDTMVEKCKEVILNYRINLLSQSKKENISNEGNYYIIFVLPIILLLLILVFYKKLNLKFFKSDHKKSSSKTKGSYRHEEKEFNTSYENSTQFKDDLKFFDINLNFKKQELLNSRKNY